jgi:hypothetical protein
MTYLRPVDNNPVSKPDDLDAIVPADDTSPDSGFLLNYGSSASGVNHVPVFAFEFH